VGHESKVQVAEYTLGVLVTAADKMAKQARDNEWKRMKREGEDPSGKTRGFIKSWLRGFIDAIWKRFKEQEDAYNAQQATAGALIRIDKSYEQVREFIKSDNKIKTAQEVSTAINTNDDAYNQGKEFGESMAMNKGIKSGESKKSKGQLR
jgi:hypothetical protein